MNSLDLIKKRSFFVIGAPKCGTTLLSTHLSEHPEISFSKPKEPHFFSRDYPFGPPEINSLEAYLSCFSCSNEKKSLVKALYSTSTVMKPSSVSKILVKDELSTLSVCATL